MNQAYLISRGTEEFAGAREQFAMIVDWLQSAAALGMEHGEVEGLISREGTELMRRLLAGAPGCACGSGDARRGGAGCRWRGTKPCPSGVSKASQDAFWGGRGEALWL